MKVTAIKQQVKHPDRYSIFIDDTFAFGLSEEALLTSHLSLGQEFNKEELLALKLSAVADKAYSQSLGLVARRPRSEWELRDYLKRKDYAPELIDQTILRLAEREYVNDEAFARAWVNNRRLLKATSKRRLAQELRQKRVRDEVIAVVLENDETDEHQVLKDLIVRKRKQSRYQDDLKLLQYLVRQGFNYGDAKAALDELN
jgi:regulatory protein